MATLGGDLSSLKNRSENALYIPSVLVDHASSLSKTQEIVFHRLNQIDIMPPLLLQDVQQVPGCRLLLGTVISSSPYIRDHIDYTLTVSTQRIYLLNKL